MLLFSAYRLISFIYMTVNIFLQPDKLTHKTILVHSYFHNGDYVTIYISRNNLKLLIPKLINLELENVKITIP